MSDDVDDSSAVRLNRFLASCGFGSRRSCETLVRDGRVIVNGQVCTELATRIRAGHDRVSVDGQEAAPARETTLILNKPPGYLCTRSDPRGRPTVYDLLPPQFKQLHHVGRLDAESQGLLVLTNSGELTAALTHPKHEIEKEYLVTLNRAFERAHAARLLEGVRTPEGLARAHAVETFSKRRLLVVLRQGLKRQIRHMFDRLGYAVLRLERVRIGQFTAEDLAPGRYRALGPGQLKDLTKTG